MYTFVTVFITAALCISIKNISSCDMKHNIDLMQQLLVINCFHLVIIKSHYIILLFFFVVVKNRCRESFRLEWASEMS